MAGQLIEALTGNMIVESVTYNNTYWDDIRIAAEATKINPVNSKPDYDTFKGGTKTLLFDPDTLEQVTFSVQIPHKWKLGTDIEPHIHWSNKSTETGVVQWGFEYTVADINGTFSANSTSYINSTALGQFAHKYQDFPTIDMSSFTDNNDVSIMIMCRFFRNSTHADDTFTQDAPFLEFDFHYEIDSPGSEEELTKKEV